ncbi:serine/threonine-protein kinase [Nocardioides sp. 616]|uniref:serine/threonine-protein kinase n=1 Tax=Nocardioides sp. 616 TaxID=2268090 RepID=UPI000CE39A31|nr:serine/threonine-protein kinase [Nocardioides sp. 616]
MTAPARIGPYLVGPRIGRGELGVVHAATDDVAGRQVALKLIGTQAADDREFRATFAREARKLSALRSEHVVPLHSFGEADGHLYLATDLFPDGDLARMLQRFGPPPLSQALELVAQVAAGLADAHSVGLIHADLKPSNVMLRRDGAGFRACLVDFGLARGAATWMAPELHHGARPDVGSDVYALGCVLWAALSGQPPYAGGTDFRTAQAHLDSPVPQLAGSSPLEQRVNAILRRALAKDPTGRHPSAAQLRDDLVAAQALPGPGSSPAAPAFAPRRPAGRTPARRTAVRRTPVRTAAVAMALLAAAALGVAGTLLVVDQDTQPPAAAVSSVPVAPDEAVAVDNMATAFAEQLVVGPDKAECIAQTWIDAVGVASLVDARFLDSRMDFYDRDLETVDADLKDQLALAVRSCLS